MYKKNKQIAEVIDAYRHELFDRDYNKGTIETYSKTCRIVQEWWDEKGLQEFDEVNAFRFCNEFIGTRYLHSSFNKSSKTNTSCCQNASVSISG